MRMSNLAEENEAIPTETGEDLEAVASTAQEPVEGAGETEVEATESEEEVIVTLGEEAPPPEEEAAPEWVRELRRKNRKMATELSRAKKKLEALEAPKPSALGKKPTLEDEDIGFDEEKYDAALAAWLKRKDAIEQAELQARKAEEEQAQAWQKRLEGYGESKRALQARIKDFDDAEAAALEILSVEQQGIIVKGAKDPALIICAIGKNLDKGKKLAAIKDPIDFAFAVAKMEDDPSSEFKMTVTKRKSPPPPERQVTGAGRISAPSSQELERLKEEARKTGDYDAYFAYKNKLAEKAKP